MLYLGIDQHAKQLTISLRNEDGEVIVRRQVSTGPKRCRTFLADLQQKASDAGYRAIVEVCGFNDWLLELLPEFGCKHVVLIQPEKKAKVKTDRRDAHALSVLLWVNRDRLVRGEKIRGVRQVQRPSKIDAENQRLTLLCRDAARRRTRVTNQIKHILRRYNLQWSMPTKTFPTVHAIAWLKIVQVPKMDRLEMDWLLEEFERCTQRMKNLELQITSRAEGIDAVERLRTIPGVSYYTALAIASRVGDPKRYARGKSLAHYWGLTPGCRDSGETKGRRGHITKAGSPMARWLLAQVTFHVLRRDPVMRRWYKPIRNRRGSNIARIAVMRRLAVIIRNMLYHEQDYAECRDAMLRRHHKQRRAGKAA